MAGVSDLIKAEWHRGPFKRLLQTLPLAQAILWLTRPPAEIFSQLQAALISSEGNATLGLYHNGTSVITRRVILFA